MTFFILSRLRDSLDLSISSSTKNARLIAKFYLVIDFKDHILQELDGKTKSDHFDEREIKIGYRCISYSMFSLFFLVTYFQNGNG